MDDDIWRHLRRPNEPPKSPTPPGSDRLSHEELLETAREASSEDLVAAVERERERREAEQVILEARRRLREPPSRWPAVVAAVVLLAIALAVVLGVAQLAAGCAS